MPKVPYQNVTLQALPGGGWDLTGSDPAKAAQPNFQPAPKTGRPKGPDRVKKTVYLNATVESFYQLRIDMAVKAGIMAKDDSDIINFGVELLAALLADPTKIEYLRNFSKKRKSKF